jgi:hypothetical protein
MERKNELSKDEIIDRAAERNARLIVQLKRMIRLFHNAEHRRGINWTECGEEDCVKTGRIIEEQDASQVRKTIPFHANGRAWRKAK